MMSPSCYCEELFPIVIARSIATKQSRRRGDGGVAAPLARNDTEEIKKFTPIASNA